jgi:hypothetical protein
LIATAIRTGPAQAVAEHVGHGELAGVAHAVGQQVEHRQEREHRAQADDPAVEAEEGHEAGVARKVEAER